MKKLCRSFGFAFCGLVSAVKNERNFRTHLVAMATVIYFSAVYGVEKWEAVCLSAMIALVLAAELFNTAIEAVVDIASPEKNPLARIAKDSAAGAVLVFALASVAVAVFVFSEPQGWKRVFEYIKENYGYVTAFAALGTGFIFFRTKEKKQ